MRTNLSWIEKNDAWFSLCKMLKIRKNQHPDVSRSRAFEIQPFQSIKLLFQMFFPTQNSRQTPMTLECASCGWYVWYCVLSPNFHFGAQKVRINIYIYIFMCVHFYWCVCIWTHFIFLLICTCKYIYISCVYTHFCFTERFFHKEGQGFWNVSSCRSDMTGFSKPQNAMALSWSTSLYICPKGSMYGIST